MDFFANIDPTLVDWVIIPLLIFLARLLDVSIGTLRIVFIAKGDKVTAPILGFFEVLIWIIAIGQVINNLNNPVAYLGWSLGFATGNYIGLRIEQKLAMGQVVMRVISPEPVYEVMNELEKLKYRTVILDAESGEGKMNVLFSIVKRKDIEKIVLIIREKMPNAFYTIEGVQQFSEPAPVIAKERRQWLTRLFPVRKAK